MAAPSLEGGVQTPVVPTSLARLVGPERAGPRSQTDRYAWELGRLINYRFWEIMTLGETCIFTRSGWGEGISGLWMKTRARFGIERFKLFPTLSQLRVPGMSVTSLGPSEGHRI